MRILQFAFVLTFASLFAVGEQATAQSPINSNVAMQPNKGGLILRQRFTHTEADKMPMPNMTGEMTMSMTTLMYGVTEKITLMAMTPYRISQRTENAVMGTKYETRWKISTISQ